MDGKIITVAPRWSLFLLHKESQEKRPMRCLPISTWLVGLCPGKKNERHSLKEYHNKEVYQLLFLNFGVVRPGKRNKAALSGT